MVASRFSTVEHEPCRFPCLPITVPQRKAEAGCALSSLDPAHQKQYEEHDQNDAHNSRRTIAPPPAVAHVGTTPIRIRIKRITRIVPIDMPAPLSLRAARPPSRILNLPRQQARFFPKLCPKSGTLRPRANPTFKKRSAMSISDRCVTLWCPLMARSRH